MAPKEEEAITSCQALLDILLAKEKKKSWEKNTKGRSEGKEIEGGKSNVLKWPKKDKEEFWKLRAQFAIEKAKRAYA